MQHFACRLVGHLDSQQQTGASQGQMLDTSEYCYTETEAGAISQYTDTEPTSPSAHPTMPGIWQGSDQSTSFWVTGSIPQEKQGTILVSLLLLLCSQLHLWASPFFFFCVPSYISGFHHSSSSVFPATSLGFTILLLLCSQLYLWASPFFFFCVPMSGVHHFRWDFCTCDRFFKIQT